MSAVRRRGLCPVRRIDGERAISAQIDSPGNVFQSVCAAVRINGFTPGVNDGNTLYNLSRSPAVREAKLPCSIWHWVPVSGRRWMGLVMVDSPSFAETVRVKVRDQEISPVVANRGDNRRHLYYWEEPFDFDFAETLEILTPDDDAPYVIEGFVFMTERPTEATVEVRTPPSVLDAPEFSATMLPGRVTITNPGARPGVQLLELTLALPGVRHVSASIQGLPCPTALVPLTRDPRGIPVNQRLQVVADLPAMVACEMALVLGNSEVGFPEIPPLDISVDDAGLHFPDATSVAPAMPGASLRLKESPGWTGLQTLRPAFRVVFALAAPDVLLEIALTTRVTRGLDGMEIEQDILVAGPGLFAVVPSLALHVQTAEGSGRTTLVADGPDFGRPALIGNGHRVLAAADFAALHPARLRADGPQLVWDVLPPGFSPPSALDRRERDQRYFHVVEGGYRLKRGMRRRQVCWLGAAREQGLRWLDPATFRVPRRYEQGLLLPEENPDETSAWRNAFLEAWLRQQRTFHADGFLNYGDWFGERGVNWGNGEYDSAYGLLLQAVQTGGGAWAELGHAAARHQIEVDTAHLHDAKPGWQYRHSMGHVGDYFDDAYEVGAIGKGSIGDTAHNWVEGMLLHYLLSGDTLALETARKLLNDLAGPVLDKTYFSNARNMGWHLIHLSAGAMVLRDPRYLAAADRLVAMILERQRLDGSWRRVLKSDHCGCYPPHTGNAGFMIGVLMEGLGSYLQITGDPRVEDSIRRAGRFLWRDLHDTETGGWRYTSCPNTPVHKPGGAEIHYLVPMLNVLRPEDADAAAWWEAFDRYRKALLEIIQAPPTAAFGQEAPGKRLSKALRLLPKVNEMDRCASPDADLEPNP